MSTDTDALVEFLRARLDKDEQWALAASKPYPHAAGDPQIPAEGLRWRFGIGPDWDPVEIDPAVQEFVDEDSGSCVLISVETWPSATSPEWMMHRRYGSVEEMDAAAAGHIERHHPARVLRDVASDRKLITRYAAAVEDLRQLNHVSIETLADPESYPALRGQHTAAVARACALREALEVRAERFDDHEDYQESWRP